MSDLYGIGNMLQTVLNIYFLGMRHNGKTTKMLKSLNKEDIVVFDNSGIAKLTQKYARELEIDIQYIVIDPWKPEQIGEKLGGRPRHGKIVFDHNFVEKFYIVAVERAKNDLSFLTKTFSMPDIEKDVEEVERNWIKK